MKKPNNSAAAQIVGLMFVLLVESLVMLTSIYGVSSTLNYRTIELGELQAQTVVNNVANAVVDCVTVVGYFPNVTYVQIIDVPEKLAGSRDYYIEMTNNGVYANSTDGSIKMRSTNYNAGELNVNITGRVMISENQIVVTCKNETITMGGYP